MNSLLTRPSLFISAAPREGVRTVDQLRKDVTVEPTRRMWAAILAQANVDASAPPLVPTSAIPGRAAVQIEKANRDYTICNAAGQRVLRAALANLLTGESRFADSALAQIDCLLDESQWPAWRDMAHKGHADLRTGMLCCDLSIAYDWLHGSLSPSRRRGIVEGIARCGIEPFFRAVDAGASWANGHSNWLTVVVGGLGIAGMALGADYSRSQELIDFSLPRMVGYLDALGSEGEFNESVAYAGSLVRPLMYFAALRHATGRDVAGAFERLAGSLRWYMHFVRPPGHVAVFGDADAGAPPQAAMFALAAAAGGDGIFQWFYLNHAATAEPSLWELLWHDPSIESVSPEAALPLGRAFAAHGACISSRSDWNPRVTASLVLSKAGHGSETHGHHDAGQVCIDGHGQPLIVDLGRPSNYPADYFGSPNKYGYYNASAWGHNVLVLGGRDTLSGQQHRAAIVASQFDNARGGMWQLELTPMYSGASHVRRSVLHLLPNLVAVLDEAELEQPEGISLRWHTGGAAAVDSLGHFATSRGAAGLAGRIIVLDGGPASFTCKQHRYEPPFDRGRMGELLEQRAEPYVEAGLHGSRCRLLTLMAVTSATEASARWQGSTDRWLLTTVGANMEVRICPTSLAARNLDTGQGWDVQL